MSVSLPCEAPPFIVACLSLGLGVQQAAPVQLVRVLRLLFHVAVLLRRTQCFAEHVCLKAPSEGQGLPDLLRAADALQVPTPPLPFLDLQEGVETSRRTLLMALALRLAFSRRRLRSAARAGTFPIALALRLASAKCSFAPPLFSSSFSLPDV